MKKFVIRARVTEEQKKILTKICKLQDITESQYIRKIIFNEKVE